MSTEVGRDHALELEGLSSDRVKWNLSTAALYEEVVRRQQGLIAAEGPLACRTGQYTGRSPHDKSIVREPSSEANISLAKVNRPMEPAHFESQHHYPLNSLTREALYV